MSLASSSIFYTKLHSLEEATRSLVSMLRASLMQYQSSLYICVCVCVCVHAKKQLNFLILALQWERSLFGFLFSIAKCNAIFGIWLESG